MLPFEFARYRMTEEGDALRVRMALDSFIFLLIWNCWHASVSFVATGLALLALLGGLDEVIGAVFNARPNFWGGLMLTGGGLVLGWVFGHAAVAWAVALPRFLFHGRDSVVLNRRLGRILSGKTDVDSLEQVMAVRYGPIEDEDGARFHVAELQFAGDTPEPYSLWTFSKPAEAETFARAVADFIGVPAVARKKPGPTPDLAALADDSLVS